jgi:N-acetylneuraminate synthase
MDYSTVQIIAEAGVNHNGSVERALDLIDAAARAGATAIKFQTFRSEHVISRRAPKAEYQKKTTSSDESQLDMVRALELDESAHHRLVARCHERKIEFLSTPFDLPSVALLVSLGVQRLKIPSGEITNPLLLRACAKTGLPLIVSTGMCTLGEIERALVILAGAPLYEPAAQSWLRERVTLLHCTTEYPAPVEDVNLRAMATMASAFGLPVGYSDHTDGIAISLAAVALGAVLIEKHVTLDRNLPGPDHKASIEPPELEQLVCGARAIARALGSACKLPSPSERKNLPIARRSLVAAAPIAKGERFSGENLTVKRPGNGISAIFYDEWIGRTATRDYQEDELID